MKSMDRIITKERIAYLNQLRGFEREDALAEAKPIVGKETIEALSSLVEIYDERMVLWYAGLYDPDIGGFYYSNTARDTELFLPDVESTRQSLTFFQRSGLFADEDNYVKGLTDNLRDKIVNYVLSLQDPDGFFYHPQWGKKIIPSRRGRDFDWARMILRDAGVSPKYPYATERSPEDGKHKLPDYLQSISAFKAHLGTMDLTKSSYSVGNWINAQPTLIKAAGEEYVDVLGKWLIDSLRSDNGLWQEKVNYDSVNGLMKISAACTRLGIYLPYSERSMESAIEAALSDEKISFCCEFYNPWCALNSVVRLAEKCGRIDELYELQSTLWQNAPRLVNKTKEKIMTCRRDDGTFSYYTDRTGAISQGASVTVEGTVEGDVNATGICSTGTVYAMCNALGIPKIPLFTHEDGKLLLDIMTNAPSVKKLYKNPYGDSLPYPKELDNPKCSD